MSSDPMIVAALTCVFFLSAIIGALYAVVIIHELGHVFFLRRAGWEFIGIRVFHFQIYTQDDRVRIAWNRDQKVSGLVRFKPRAANVKDALSVYAGGWIFNLVTGASFLLIAQLAFPSRKEFIFSHVIFLILGLLSVIMGITSMLPFHTSSGMLTDGQILWMYLRRRDLFEAWIETLPLMNAVQEMRPRDFPADLLEPNRSNAPYRAFLYLFRYWSALDAGDVDQAEIDIQAAWENVDALKHIPVYQAMIAFETSMFFRRFVDDVELSDRAYECGLNADRHSITRRSADAVRMLSQGKRSEVQKIFSEDMRRMESLAMGQRHLIEHVREWHERILNPNLPLRKRGEKSTPGIPAFDLE